ncbi:MAG: hypothetical protein MUC92_11525 [Fimbriimonadaceae bacterium]|jgi:hypothetical protein|nr:hypothetical protein [Fimbriimonadaceae bacterium]
MKEPIRHNHSEDQSLPGIMIEPSLITKSPYDIRREFGELPQLPTQLASALFNTYIPRAESHPDFDHLLAMVSTDVAERSRSLQMVMLKSCVDHMKTLPHAHSVLLLTMMHQSDPGLAKIIAYAGFDPRLEASQAFKNVAINFLAEHAPSLSALAAIRENEIPNSNENSERRIIRGLLGWTQDPSNAAFIRDHLNCDLDSQITADPRASAIQVQQYVGPTESFRELYRFIVDVFKGEVSDQNTLAKYTKQLGSSADAMRTCMAFFRPNGH